MAAKYAIKNITDGTYYRASKKTWSPDLSKAQLCSTKPTAKRSKSAALKHADIFRDRATSSETYPDPGDEVKVVKVAVQEAPEE